MTIELTSLLEELMKHERWALWHIDGEYVCRIGTRANTPRDTVIATIKAALDAEKKA
jgi:hypothetical protein